MTTLVLNHQNQIDLHLNQFHYIINDFIFFEDSIKIPAIFLSDKMSFGHLTWFVSYFD